MKEEHGETGSQGMKDIELRGNNREFSKNLL